MPRRAAIALLLVFGTTGVQAASPGFDCGKAATVMERLICTDGGLAAMDQSMTNAFKDRRSALSPAEAKPLLQQQRDWIKQRNAACPMPPLTADEDFTPQQMWQLAPCVAAQYRQRLTALGVAPPPIPPVAQRPDFIHPVCLSLAMSGETPRSGIPLTACNKGNAHVPLQERSGFLSAEGGISSAVVVNGGYWPLGKLGDGRHVFRTEFNYGGTGWFTAIAAVTLRPQADDEVMLSVEIVHAGGDRCNLGIVNATLSKDTLQVTHDVTPSDLLNADRALPYNTLSSGLLYCATCCIGTVSYTHPLGRQETITSVRIKESAGLALIEDKKISPQDRCLARALRASTPTFPRDYAPAELRNLVKTVETCIRGE